MLQGAPNAGGRLQERDTEMKRPCSTKRVIASSTSSFACLGDAQDRLANAAHRAKPDSQRLQTPRGGRLNPLQSGRKPMEGLQWN